MVAVTKQISMNVPPGEIWETLSKFDQISKWATFVSHSSQLTERSSGIGCARRIQQGSNTIVETITEWEENQVLAYTLSGFPPVFRRVTNRWLLEPDGSGTKISLTVELLPIRPPANLPALIVGTIVGRINKNMLKDLKKFIEESRNTTGVSS